jgi:hypothetical protein
MSYPAEYKIEARQGATFRRTLTWYLQKQLVNLTGYTARMQVRSSAASSTALLSATTENSYITLGGAAGTITLNIPANIMAGIPAGRYVYDLELVTGSEVTSLLAGRFIVTAEVTR